MKFINTLEDFDLREYYKQNPYNEDILNYDIFTLLYNNGFKFTQNQFTELFFARRSGKSYLKCYKLFIKIYTLLKASNKESYEYDFKEFAKDKGLHLFIRQFREIFGKGIKDVIEITYPKKFTIKVTKLKDFGKEIYE